MELKSALTILAFNLCVDARWSPPPEYSLSLSRNGRYFQDASGKPFFWQADTAWLLTHRLNYTETKTYLADRASKGFNVILNVGFTQIGIDSPNRNGDLTFHDEDVTRPNEPYWAYIDSIAELAWQEYGIRMALIPAWGNYAHDGIEPSVITPENGEVFGEFIGRRYPYMPKLLFGDTNPYWADDGAIQDDYNSGGVPGNHTSVDFRPVYDAVGWGIVKGERNAIGKKSHRPLLSIHPRNQWMPDAPIALASANLGDRDYITFDAAQSGHADTPPHPPIPWWNARRGYETVEEMWKAGTKGRKRPAIDNEPHYELRWSRKAAVDKAPWNATDVRVGSWQTALSGAAGITYGNDNVMQMYIPGLYDPANSGIVKAWSDSLEDPGAEMMQHIKKIMLDRGAKSFFTRTPAQDSIMGDSGKDDARLTAMRDEDGSWLMVYSPLGGSFTIDLSTLRGKNLKASWYDPLTGAYQEGQSLRKQAAVNNEVKFTAPKSKYHDDWVLLIEEHTRSMHCMQ